jgi:hypothetical protein
MVGQSEVEQKVCPMILKLTETDRPVEFHTGAVEVRFLHQISIMSSLCIYSMYIKSRNTLSYLLHKNYKLYRHHIRVILKKDSERFYHQTTTAPSTGDIYFSNFIFTLVYILYKIKF